MKKIITILSFITFLTTAHAQLFKNNIGKPNVTEYSNSITQSADSTYLVGGYYFGSASDIPFVTHLNKNGGLDWAKEIVIPETTYPLTFAEAVKKANGKPDGYIATVSTNDGSYLVRLTNNGSVTWSRSIATSLSNTGKVRLLYNNTGTLTGFIILANYGKAVIKTDAAGITVWQKELTSSTPDTYYRFTDIQVTADGGCIATGNRFSGGLYSLPVLFRFTSLGTVVWGRTYVFTSNGEPNPRMGGVAVTNTGFAVTGTGSGTWNKNLTFKTDFSGNLLWSFNYTASDALNLTLEGNSIIEDLSGNFAIVCGERTTNRNGVILKLSASGALVYAKKFSSIGSFSNIKLSNTGNYCISGRGNFGNGADIAALNISTTAGVAAACRSVTVSLTFAATPVKITGFPVYGQVNAAFTNIAATLRTAVLNTQESLCSNQPLVEEKVTSAFIGRLQVANDVSSKRVMITWVTPNKQDNTVYEAIIYNNAGQPQQSLSLHANQPVFIAMDKMQDGIYLVTLKQGERLVAKEQMVWFK